MLWRFGPMIYGPTLLFSLGEGAVIPLIPVIAAQLGAGVALAALVSSALVVGQLCGNLPAGWAVARVGERVTMAVGGSAAIAAAIGLIAAPNLATLTIAVFVLGFCAAVFGLARHSFMTTRIPLSFRARALSLLGGSFRLGVFIGPFVAAALLAIFGDAHAAIWFALVCLIGVVLLVVLGPDPEHDAAAALARTQPSPELDEDTGEAVTGPVRVNEARIGVFRTMWRHRQVLARLGVAAALLSSVRSARQVVLPLWGVSIGLDAQTIALVVGISGALDFALFYASGQVMDRFGRLWAALPAMLLMGAGFLALAFTHDHAEAAMWFALFAAVLGVGNGMSSGILMTLGADLAPQADPAAFLGSWRTLTDAGGAAAPLLVSAITALVSLSLATGVMGLVGVVGAFAFLRWIPRYIPRR
ncbi:MFS transporter [Microbacterium protaetiae]|uniref:MFS transporter n=1 Tax=Microbacterium protaetiae TaxID=2509458 RepID=A0A4P6EHT4_9MICO|nr:MFS transporter [Microbacterium protaetiae]